MRRGGGGGGVSSERRRSSCSSSHCYSTYNLYIDIEKGATDMVSNPIALIFYAEVQSIQARY